MKAALLESPRNISVRDVPVPEVRLGTILVRVRACGICGSDMKFYTHGDRVDKFPRILGHEVSGEVVEVGKGVQKFRVGDRIAMGNEIPCSECEACRMGLENICDRVMSLGVTIDGGFSEYMLMPEPMVERGPVNVMPEGISFEEGALAEPLGCVVNGLEFAKMSEGKSVLVIGAGPIGCMIINMARILGASKIVVVDKNARRLDMSRHFKADHYVYAENGDFLKEVLDLSNRKGYDVVMSACSDTDAHSKAILASAKGGFVNLFGGVAKGIPDEVKFPNNFIHYRQAVIGGSFSQTKRHHKMALDYLASGRINSSKIITHRFKLEDVVKAIETVKSCEGLKVMVLP